MGEQQEIVLNECPHGDKALPSCPWCIVRRQGDTPETNPSAAFAAAVIARWQQERANAKPKKVRKAATAQHSDAGETK